MVDSTDRQAGRYKAYPEYKDSGVGWLGEIPSGWDSSAVWMQFEIGRGRVISNEEIASNVGIYPVYSSQTFNDGVMGYIDTYDFDGNYITWTTDGANAGTVFTRSGKFNCTNVCGTLKSNKSETNIRFYMYALSMANKWFVRHDINPKLMNNVISAIRVPVCSILEQNQIANFLDYETAKIDTLIEKQQRLIELLTEKRQAVISLAVTKGLNPDVPMRDSGVEWLGEVPAHWELVPLKYLCRFSGGGTPTKDNLSYWTNGTIPWVSPKDMKSFWINKTQDYITETAVKESSTSLVEAGTLLMVVRSGILQRTIPIAINTVPVTLNQDMKALKFNSRVSSEYVANYILGNIPQLLLEWSKEGATVESIEQEYLSNSLIPVPPKDEQSLIVDSINTQMQVFSDLSAKAQQQIQLMQERRTALISAAVTGKIDVRDWVKR